QRASARDTRAPQAVFVRERVVIEPMHQRGEPPGQTSGLPHPGKGSGRVLFQKRLTAGSIEFDQSLIEYPNVPRREIQTLGPSRWNDVRRIADEKKSAEVNGFGHEATQRRSALLDRWPRDQTRSVSFGQAPPQFVPESLIRPVLNL